MLGPFEGRHPDRYYFLNDHRERVGPHSFADLKEMWCEDRLPTTTMVFCRDTKGWRTVSAWPELRRCLGEWHIAASSAEEGADGLIGPFTPADVAAQVEAGNHDGGARVWCSSEDGAAAQAWSSLRDVDELRRACEALGLDVDCAPGRVDTAYGQPQQGAGQRPCDVEDFEEGLDSYFAGLDQTGDNNSFEQLERDLHHEAVERHGDRRHDEIDAQLDTWQQANAAESWNNVHGEKQQLELRNGDVSSSGGLDHNQEEAWRGILGGLSGGGATIASTVTATAAAAAAAPTTASLYAEPERYVQSQQQQPPQRHLDYAQEQQPVREAVREAVRDSAQAYGGGANYDHEYVAAECGGQELDASGAPFRLNRTSIRARLTLLKGAMVQQQQPQQQPQLQRQRRRQRLQAERWAAPSGEDLGVEAAAPPAAAPARSARPSSRGVARAREQEYNAAPEPAAADVAAVAVAAAAVAAPAVAAASAPVAVKAPMPEVAANGPPQQLEKCCTCSRTFSATTLERHARICAKAGNKKSRKKFDSAAVRKKKIEELAGVKLSQVATRKPRKSKKNAKKKKAKWKKQSEDFRNAMRAGRGASPIATTKPSRSQNARRHSNQNASPNVNTTRHGASKAPVVRAQLKSRRRSGAGAMQQQQQQQYGAVGGYR